MKYFFAWLAFFALLTLLVPAGLNMGFVTENPSSDKKDVNPKISVYFHKEDITKDMDIEHYIRGVLMAEMPAEFELEALKAQAVAARTYTAEKINSDGGKSHPGGALVCTDFSHCQAYISDEDAKGKWGKNASLYFEKCKKAVEATSDIIAVYEEKPIKAVFHSVSGGKTENAADVWGEEVRYLVSVDSPGEDNAPKYRSTVEFDIEEFKTLAKTHWDADASGNLIDDIKRSNAGGVISARIGDKLVKGTQIRSVFGLNSTDFEIVPGEKTVVFNVKGYGHGVGMSQYGANYYAEQGMGYKEILRKYYQGVEFAHMNKKPA